MVKISKRMIKAWCKINGEPGYLLTTGAKIAQSAVIFEETTCSECMKEYLDKRHEAYIVRFNMCLYCHSKKLFPNNLQKQNTFRLNMLCTKSVGRRGARYNVDYMLRTCVRYK
jgi:hydrogenase maturation factor HypF (carbamoyltransferase family)